jgi:hypothetical protein
LKHATRKRRSRGSQEHFDLPENANQGDLNWWSRKDSKQSRQTWSISTASGDVQISLPNQLAPTRNPQRIQEAGLNFTFAQNRSTLEVRARFFRDLTYASQSRICAQLNVFVKVDDRTTSICSEMIRRGTIPEIDAALRNGIISPFYLDWWGNNIFLYVSTFFPRTKNHSSILHELKSGLWSIRQEMDAKIFGTTLKVKEWDNVL